MYHGTNAEFDTFNKNMVSNYSAYSKNFYFTENKQRATDYGNKILSVYLKSDNLFDVELNLPTREDIEKINTILSKDGLKLEGDYGFDGMYMTGENFLNDLGVMTEQDYDYLLKEIGYDGIKSKDEFIVFDPNQIKSVDNRGTYSTVSDNIYYQGKIVDSFKNLFNPLVTDINKFRNIFRKAISGEIGENTVLQISENTPEVYKILGFDDKPMGISNKTIKKANIGKHNVPLNILEELPEFVFDPVAVLDSKTNEGSLVSILNAIDENGDTIVAIIKPTNGKYNIIPSVYGKNDLDNLIKSSKIRYTDIERANLTIRPSSLQLLGVYSNIGSLTKSDITQNSDVVKQKGRRKVKGSFDKLTKSIKITSEADFSTYQHEFAHFWLDNMWDYANSGKASETYLNKFNEVKKWLGVRDSQTYFTREQHEKFARGYEKFLFEGKTANPIIASTFDDYDKFIRDVYDDITEIDTRAGKKYTPLTREMYNFFNSMVGVKLPEPEGLGEPTIEETREIVTKQNNDAKDVVKEETRVYKEGQADYSLKPVQTDTRKGYLTALEKTTGEKVEAGTVTLQDELKKAEKFVSENMQLAEDIVNGKAPVHLVGGEKVGHELKKLKKEDFEATFEWIARINKLRLELKNCQNPLNEMEK